MLYPTITFAIFFVIVLPLSWLLMPRPSRWRMFMLAASYFFYGYWNPRFVLLLVVSTLWNWMFAAAITRSPNEGARRGLLAVAVAGNLGVLAYFKYYNFFLESATNMLSRIGIDISPTIVAITLPVGISFFTFQAISYVVDVYRNDTEPVSLIEFAVYLSFFPGLVAGPIVRASEFLPQLRERHDPRRIDSSRAFFLIGLGLFKKVVIANFLASAIVDPVFGSPDTYSGLENLVAVYAFAVQIYADFSGYTDIAIGIALLLGFRFPQNFDAPYTSTSIQDFWRRWHMTLSRWLRDYLYVPLGGNRKSANATYVNLMVVMLLGGLWHGAAWTFVIWGAIHGGFLAFEHWRRQTRLAAGAPEPADTVLTRTIRRVVVFNIVCLAWVFFRAETFSNAFDVLSQIATGWGQPSPLVTRGVLLAIAIGIGAQYIPKITMARAWAMFSRLSPVAQGVVLGVGLLFVDSLGPTGIAPFLYFQF